MDRLSLLNPERLGTLVAQEAQGEVDALDLAGSGKDPMGTQVIAALDRLEVEWRFGRPDVISAAKKEAVARLDAFVGPKY